MEVSKENVQNIYPLSPTQEGMLFHFLADDDPEAYVQQISYRVRGTLDAHLFETSWNKLVQRHDILRTAIIHTHTKQPLQVVLKQRALDFRFEDLTGLGVSGRTDWLEHFKEQDRKTPFDPARGMLMRVALLRLDTDLHEVVWTHHHILTDGWSLGILQSELVEIYHALREGRDDMLPAAPPYGRYIRFLESLDADASAAYWRQYLAGYSRQASIPPSASGSERESREYTIVLPEDLVAGLETLARDREVTLNTVLQSAWAVLLGHYSAAEDIVLGTVVSGRPPHTPGIDRMAGLFVNTVPLRFRVPATVCFREVLAAAQYDAVLREQHQYFPLAKTQAESELKQNLIACVTAMENYPVERQFKASLDAMNLGFSVEEVRVSERTHYDFLVQFLPGLQLRAKFQFNAAIHAPEAIARLGRQYERILTQAVAEPSLTIRELQRGIVDDAPVRRTRYVQATPVHRLVEARAAASPEVIAISCEGETITYAALNARANRLAHHLRRQGVRRETRVGICCERSVDLIVSMLAVWKAGGAFVPMDPAYPAERLAYLRDDAEVHLVISGADSIETISPNGEDHTQDNLAIEPEPSQAAYIIYTSGSTGRPKGCVVTQENVSRLFAATDPWFHFGQSDVWTMFHSAAFDFSVWEIWGALAYGGRLVIVPYWVSRSPDDFLALLEAERVTVLNQTPSAFRQLMAAGLPERASNLALRIVVFGGEALNLPGLAPWFACPLADRAQLVNMYGITETTVHVTYRIVTRQDVAEGVGSRIGAPIPDLAVVLLDGEGWPVLQGVAGEIYIAGAGVARGYWKRPALTAARFVPDPVGPPGSRLYRSGDLARHINPDDLEYLGRADEQVKIRGFRIELGEIEGAISGFAGVREVAVAALEADGEKRLVAYLAGPEDSGFMESLREYLAASLPMYMLPAAFVRMSKLPLTIHGKVDRKALPAPTWASRDRYAPPATETEAALAEVWRQVLGVSQVGLHDPYLELGGDSISAIRIVSALLSRKLKIGVRDLFRYPTIAQLAPYVQSCDIGPVKQTALTSAPLSPVQAWFLAQQRVDPYWFNHAVFVRLPADANIQAIQKTWEALWARHEALRLRFVQHDSGWTQELITTGCPRVECISPAQRDHCIEEAQRSFNLQTGPLLRLLCFRSAEECRLLIIIHHLVIDAISWQVLLNEFGAVYNQVQSGVEIELPPVPGSFLRWSASQPAWNETLPVRKCGVYSDALHQNLRLSVDETTDLTAHAPAAYNTNVEELLLAALARALREWRGEQTGIMVEFHGREENPEMDISRTVGWFTSIQPLLLHADQSTDTGRLIRQTKETLRRTPRSGVRIDDALLRFNYLGNSGAQFSSNRVAFTTDGVGQTVSPRSIRPVELELSAIILDEQLEISLSFNPNTFSARYIAELLALYQQALLDVIRHCCGRDVAEVTPSDLTYSDLSLEELDRMLL